MDWDETRSFSYPPTSSCQVHTHKVDTISNHPSALVPVRYLAHVDGGGLGFHFVVKVTRVSLSLVVGNGWKTGDFVLFNVSVVGRLKGTLVSGLDGGEDGVGLGDGSALQGLVLGSGVGTRVEQDEGVLLVGDGGEVSLAYGILEGDNSLSVKSSGTADGGGRDSTISRGDLRKGNNGSSGGGSSGLSEGNTAADLQIEKCRGRCETERKDTM